MKTGHVKRIRRDTKRQFLKKGTCSRALFYILDREFGHPQDDEERAAELLAGGIVQRDTSADFSGAPSSPWVPSRSGAGPTGTAPSARPSRPPVTLTPPSSPGLGAPIAMTSRVANGRTS